MLSTEIILLQVGSCRSFKITSLLLSRRWWRTYLSLDPFGELAQVQRILWRVPRMGAHHGYSREQPSFQRTSYPLALGLKHRRWWQTFLSLGPPGVLVLGQHILVRACLMEVHRGCNQDHPSFQRTFYPYPLGLQVGQQKRRR